MQRTAKIFTRILKPLRAAGRWRGPRNILHAVRKIDLEKRI
jgi:hypothetical protein